MPQTRSKYAVKTSGQLISIKTLLYLVLVIFFTLLAFMVLVRIYNALIGSDATAQDARLLADTVNAMLADEREYIQVPILLRIEGSRIVGFDPSTPEVRILDTCGTANTVVTGYGTAKTGVSSSTTTPTSPLLKTGCDKKSCICSSKDGKVGVCFDVMPPKDVELRLIGNFEGYNHCERTAPNLNIQSERLYTELPDGMKGEYTEFIIDKKGVRYLEKTDKLGTSALGTGATTKKYPAGTDTKPNAIIPVILEKFYDKAAKKAYIIISPDSDNVRGRLFYLYRCPDKVGDDVCWKKTGNEVLKEKQTQYCAPALSSPACRIETMRPCSAFCGLVSEPCTCEALEGNSSENPKNVATYGFCTGTPSNWISLNCNTVNNCDDYCDQEGEETCTGAELAACSYDACRVTKSGQFCQIETASTQGIAGQWNLIRAAWDKTVFTEKCTAAGTGTSNPVNVRVQCS